MDTWTLFIGIQGVKRPEEHGEPPNGWWKVRGTTVHEGPPWEELKRLAARSTVKCAKSVSGRFGDTAIVYKTGISFQKTLV